MKSTYDPFVRGRFPVGVHTIEGTDRVRKRVFPIEIWYPASPEYAGQDLAEQTQDTFTVPPTNAPRKQMAVRDADSRSGTYPLIVFSHGSAFPARRMSSFLCTHLSSHGYVVAAMNHSELVAPELGRKAGETDEQRAERVEGWIANRVPDIRFLLDFLLQEPPWDPDISLDPMQIGITGHSFGGWAVLSATAVEWRIRSVVALAPGGNSKPKPGIIPAQLTFAWGRDVPTLYLAGESDVLTPLEGIQELYSRTPSTKQMVILRRADHSHFMDNIETEHEAARAMPFTGNLAWIPKEMRPISELCSGEHAYIFVRGLTTAHMDATLRQLKEAQQFLAGDVESELASRGIESIVFTE